MTIRTIALILDLPNNRPAIHGKSFLAYMQDVLIEVLQKLEIGDRVLLYENGKVHLCNMVGEAIAAVANYKCRKIHIDEAWGDVVETISLLEEEDDMVWFFIVTDKFREYMKSACEMRAKDNIGNTYLWTVGIDAMVDGINCRGFSDITEITANTFDEAIFTS